jgi:hypothetical protein
MSNYEVLQIYLKESPDPKLVEALWLSYKMVMISY